MNIVERRVPESTPVNDFSRVIDEEGLAEEVEQGNLLLLRGFKAKSPPGFGVVSATLPKANRWHYDPVRRLPLASEKGAEADYRRYIYSVVDIRSRISLLAFAGQRAAREEPTQFVRREDFEKHAEGFVDELRFDTREDILAIVQEIIRILEEGYKFREFSEVLLSGGGGIDSLRSAVFAEVALLRFAYASYSPEEVEAMLEPFNERLDLYSHKWEPGDAVLFSNRFLLHRRGGVGFKGQGFLSFNSFMSGTRNIDRA